MSESRKNLRRRALFLFLSAALLLSLSQVTRFENDLILRYSSGVLSAEAHGLNISVDLPDLSIMSLSAVFQRSMAGEVKLRGVHLRRKGMPDIKLRWQGVYLAGHDVFSSLQGGLFPDFVSTFGDWWMDNYFSSPEPLMDGPFGSDWELQVRSVGRGSLNLEFSGEYPIRVRMDDGLMENVIAIYGGEEGELLAAERPREAPATNVMRIANFFIEGVLGALLSCVAFQIAVWVFGLGRHICSKRCWRAVLVLGSYIRVRRVGLAVAALALLHLLLSYNFSHYVLGATPHIPDSDNYYRLAKLLSNGMLSTNLPAEPWAAFESYGALIRSGQLTYFYAFFWPAILAFFMRLGVPELANPLLSSLCVVLMFMVGRLLYSRRVALLAAAIYSLCPFTIIMAGDFMSHTATQFCLLVAIYALLRFKQNWHGSWLFVSGLLAGYALCLRQVTAVAVLVPFIVFVLCSFSAGAFMRKGWLFVVAACPMIFLYCLNNKFLTGSFLTSPYVALHGMRMSFDFFSFAANWGDSMLGFLPPVLFSMPFAFLPMALVFIFIWCRPKGTDWLLFCTFLSLLIPHLFINRHGLHGYGPRFLFEGVFALILLAARGISSLSAKEGLRSRFVMVCLVALGFGFNIWSLRTTLPLYWNYNYLNPTVLDRLKSLDLSKSIVLVPDAVNWWELGITATLFDPRFEQSLIIRTLSDGSHQRILEKYSDRTVYVLKGEDLDRMEEFPAY